MAANRTGIQIMNPTSFEYILLLFFLLSPAAAMALPFEFGGQMGLESFNWQEFDQNGQQNEEETGVRYVFSGFLHSKPDPERLKLFIYGAEIKLYTATTDYTDNNAANANADYESTWGGISLEGELGLRVGRMPFAWEFVARPGFDSWIRTLDDNLNTATRTVQAEEEQYTVATVGLGTGPAWRSGRWYGRLIGGVKYASALVNIPADKSGYNEDLEFDIEGKTTGFALISNTIQITDRFLMKIDGYYDTYHFKRSETKIVGRDVPPPVTSDVTIPDRKLRNYGVHAGVSVNF